MTGDGVPANPSVLNTTALSNFAYIDEPWVIADLSGICTVPVLPRQDSRNRNVRHVSNRDTAFLAVGLDLGDHGVVDGLGQHDVFPVGRLDVSNRHVREDRGKGTFSLVVHRRS